MKNKNISKHRKITHNKQGLPALLTFTKLLMVVVALALKLSLVSQGIVSQ